MSESRLARRAVKHPSVTRAGCSEGFRAALALFLIFLGLKQGKQEIGIAPRDFGWLGSLCGSGREKSGCSVSVREVGEGGAI